MFIQRNYERTKHDDFVLNVENHLKDGRVATEQYDSSGEVVGWRVHFMYE